MKLSTSRLSLLLAAAASTTTAQSVTCDLRPDYAAPVMAEGWESRLIATGLRSPRSILFDSNGALLVVEQLSGIKHLQLANGNGTCLSVARTITLVNNSAVCLLSPIPSFFSITVRLGIY